MTIRSALTGGSPRSLGNTEEIVLLVLGDQDALPELFECIFCEDPIVRMRAGDAVEKVCRQHPDWLEPYVDRLVRDVAAIDQASVQWHLTQMISEVTLTAEQRQRAVEIMKRNLTTSGDWIVLNYTIEVLAGFAADDDDLAEYLAPHLVRLKSGPHKSVASRATKLLAKMASEAAHR